jgi:Sap, sulfolipid-1-addressing protein
MGDYIGWAFFAAVNPTLLAATTAMIMLPHPRRLMFGYLLGALLTSISLGLVIVWELQANGTTIDTAKTTVAPIIDIVFGSLLLLVAWVISSGRDTRRRARAERRREARVNKPPPRWRREMDKGSARITFVVGVCLTLPGLSYLIGMNGIAEQGYSKVGALLAVAAFCLVMLMLIEIPLLTSLVAPDWTDRAMENTSKYLRANGGRILLRVTFILGGLLVLRGVLNALGIIG